MKDLILLHRLLDAEIDPAYAKRACFILDAIYEKKPKNILEVGCGRGFYLKALSYFDFPKQIVGVDINPDYIEEAKQSVQDTRIKLIQGSIYDLPFKQNSFDLVICSEVLEHLRDDRQALLVLRKLVKPGGYILGSVPNIHYPFLWDPLNWILEKFFKIHIPSHIWWLAGIWADHSRLYSYQDIKSLFAKTRFSIEKIELFIHSCIPFSHFLLYAIGKNIVEKLKPQGITRFSLKPSRISYALAWFMRIPNRNEYELTKDDTSVNIVFLLKKLNPNP
jgi:2-polyprenyl-3-methyl-5-hydroxy-6-metoxy-1,4-benzoquinol methylase